MSPPYTRDLTSIAIASAAMAFIAAHGIASAEADRDDQMRQLEERHARCIEIAQRAWQTQPRAEGAGIEIPPDRR